MKMMLQNRRIRAIFADYDGTLCPTAGLRTQDGTFIPAPLEETMWSLSMHVPICIISSKDFQFLVNRAPFANAFSCILGIETLVVKRRNGIEPDIEKHKLLISRAHLKENASKLQSIAHDVRFKFPFVTVEKKMTRGDLLAGITMDWREKRNWEEPRKQIESYAESIVSDYNARSPTSRSLYLKTYSSHPFLDIYSTRCDKGTALKYLLATTNMNDKDGQIMYFGDSENDNPAFHLADISIGIRSDPRLKPRLECDFILPYRKLAFFLQGLLRDEMILSNESLKMLHLRNNSRGIIDTPKCQREIPGG
jgi:HAD superfamily hydrolase (TIGR01484 family)